MLKTKDKILLALSACALCLISNRHLQAVAALLPLVAFAWYRMGCTGKGMRERDAHAPSADYKGIALKNGALVAMLVALFGVAQTEIVSTHIGNALLAWGGALALICASIPFAMWMGRDMLYSQNGYNDSPRFNRWTIMLSQLTVAIAIVVLILCSFTDNIWVEETYSMGMIGFSMPDICRLVLTDAHPPLYYLLEHLMELCLTPIVGNAVYAAKLAAMVPYIIMLVLMLTVVRRRYGNWVAWIGAACMFGMPHMMYYAGEIRMYGWAGMWMLCALLCLDKIVSTEQGRGRIFAAILLVVTALGAAYTHHYGALSVFALYLAWGIWLIATRASFRQNWLLQICTAIVIIGCYIPELRTTTAQVDNVNREFWLSPLTFEEVRSYIIYLPGNLAMLLVCLYLFIGTLRKNCDAPSHLRFVAITATLMPLFLMAVAIVVSFCSRNIFLPRYMMPAIPCMWLGFVLMARKGMPKTSASWWFAVSALLLSAANIGYYALDEVRKERSFHQAQDFLNDNKGAIFISDSSHSGLEEKYVIGTRDVYLWSIEVDPHIRELYDFSNPGSVGKLSQIDSLVHTGRPVIWLQELLPDAEPVDVDSIFAGSGLKPNEIAEINIYYPNKVYLIENQP